MAFALATEKPFLQIADLGFLFFNRKRKLLENYWMADHATGPVDTSPMLVMDMYEHAYQMDYGAAAAKYIDAFFANIHWDKVTERLSV